MAVSFVAAGVLSATAASLTTTPALPAGLASGDVLIMLVQARGASATVSIPTGYSATANNTIAQTTSHRASWFYKVATGGEVAVAATQTVSGLIVARTYAFRGCDQTTPIDVTPSANKSAAATTFAADSVTPASAAAMAVWLFSVPDDCTLNGESQGTAVAGAGGDTLTGADGCVGLVYELQSSVAATGTTSLTQSANGPDNWNTFSLALRPAAVAAANPSVTMANGILCAVEIGFGSGVYSPSPTYTDVTTSVRVSAGLSIDRGSNDPFSAAQTGTCSFTLDNRARLYDPLYTAGIYYGKLVPGTPVRVRARVSSTNYTVFTGFVTSWEQTYDVSNHEAVCHVQAVDLLAFLGQTSLPSTAVGLQILADEPSVYFPMQEDAGADSMATDATNNGWDCRYSHSTSSTSTITYGEPSAKAKKLTVTAPFLVTYLVNSQPSVTIDLWNTLECWIRVDSLIADGTTNTLLQVSVGSSNSTIGIAIGSVQNADGSWTKYLAATLYDATLTANASWTYYDLPAGATVYHLVAMVDSTVSTFFLYLNGQSVEAFTIGGTFDSGSAPTQINIQAYNPVAVYVAHLAAYEHELTEDRILAHYRAGITGGNLDVDVDRLDAIAEVAGLVDVGLWNSSALTGNTYLGASGNESDVLTAMRSIVDAMQGRLFVTAGGVLTVQDRFCDIKYVTTNAVSQATLADSGSLSYSDLVLSPSSRDQIKNIIEVQALGATVRTQDAASKTQYGPMTDSVTVPLGTSSDAQNLGAWRLRRFAQPTTRIAGVTLRPVSSTDTRWAICLGAEIGYRYTIQRTPQGVGSAISQESTVVGIKHTFDGVSWETEFTLEPAVSSYTQAPYWTIADATYGRVGTPAGNKIPY